MNRLRFDVRLVIQIPCLNEAATLPRTLADLPRTVPGFASVEVLVVDDGSSDGTAAVARAAGADHVLELPGHRGLGVAFRAGLHAAVALGADVIVNTDADTQYRGRDVAALTAPVVRDEADLVVGRRDHAHAGVRKRLLQRLGSWTFGRWAGVPVPDAASGFRALSRAAAESLELRVDFTHTLETLVRARALGLRIVHVPVGTNPPVRPSRLAPSSAAYVTRNARSLARLYAGGGD
jgi:glycosyltransferase involved in cell wall biosynthesis